MLLTKPAEVIETYLRSIAKRDPEGLGGVRTTPEIAERIKLSKDATRHVLDHMRAEGRILCLGPLKSELHMPLGWMIA